MMKWICGALVGLAFFSPTWAADSFVKSEHVTFTGIELRAKEIQPGVFAVQVPGNQKNKDKQDDWRALGSGFFVRRSDGVWLGITCRHIVQAAAKMKAPIFVGFDDEKKGYIRLPSVVDYVDSKHDIAVLRLQKGSYKQFDPSSKTFPRKWIGTRENLVPGRGVIIPGYPLGLGVGADANHPVIRFGIIAQYTGGETFLIDGVASHGNSGSPVFCLKELKVVGMITAHQADRINLFDEHGKVVAGLPYNAGLAQALSAEVIGGILDDLKNKTAQPEDSGDKQ